MGALPYEQVPLSSERFAKQCLCPEGGPNGTRRCCRIRLCDRQDHKGLKAEADELHQGLLKDWSRLSRLQRYVNADRLARLSVCLPCQDRKDEVQDRLLAQTYKAPQYCKHADRNEVVGIDARPRIVLAGDGGGICSIHRQRTSSARFPRLDDPHHPIAPLVQRLSEHVRAAHLDPREIISPRLSGVRGASQPASESPLPYPVSPSMLPDGQPQPAAMSDRSSTLASSRTFHDAPEQQTANSASRAAEEDILRLQAENAALRAENAALRAENAALKAEDASVQRRFQELLGAGYRVAGVLNELRGSPITRRGYRRFESVCEHVVDVVDMVEAADASLDEEEEEEEEEE